MTFQEFDTFQAELLAEVVKMKDTKGREYANSESRFANFDRLALSLGLTNIQVGWVYTTKHLDSIASFCKNGQTYSTESIRGRIVDAITYLTLIAGMIEEGPNKAIEIKTDRYVCKYCAYGINMEHGLSPYKHVENVPCSLGRDGHSFVLKPL